MLVTSTHFPKVVWLLTLVVVCLALLVWIPATPTVSSYSVFPLFGIVAFSLMWVHYIGGAGRRYLRLPEETLQTYTRITGYFVLFFLLAHPVLLILQLFIDGFGLPYQSIPVVYPLLVERIAVLAGVTALVFFLLFELQRFYKQCSWWKYVEWANVIAMGLILWHGLTLGGELRQPWFQIVWGFYAVTFMCAVAYTEYRKRKEQ